MKVIEISEHQQVALQNQRKDLLRLLEPLDYSEVVEFETKHVPRTRWEIIDRIVSSDAADIAKMHVGEALDQPQFDDDERDCK